MPLTLLWNQLWAESNFVHVKSSVYILKKGCSVFKSNMSEEALWTAATACMGYYLTCWILHQHHSAVKSSKKIPSKTCWEFYSLECFFPHLSGLHLSSNRCWLISHLPLACSPSSKFQDSNWSLLFWLGSSQVSHDQSWLGNIPLPRLATSP